MLALTNAGRFDEAIAAAKGLVAAAEATENLSTLSFALFVTGVAYHDAEPGPALDLHRRAFAIAQDNGNRANETQAAVALCRLEASCGDRAAALNYATLAISNFHNSGNPTLRAALAVLALDLNDLLRHEAAAVILGYAFDPMTSKSF